MVTLFLCGDVMLGRGVDQILPHAGDPTLRERYVRDARAYVQLAEQANGPIPRPVDVTWPWGDALPVLDEIAPDARVINLETSITSSDEFARGKGIHYRMHPGNIPCLAAARPDVCVLANNHVLDFGRSGLAETLDTLSSAKLPAAGAGHDITAARQPATVAMPGDGRVLVFSFGMASSGIPADWAATDQRSGVDFVPDLADDTATGSAERACAAKEAGDIVVASIHWGSNWGYDVFPDQIRFAHRLIDAGVDVVHGHSSHHPRPIDVYRGKLILYGCGDFIDDYEGIGGHAEYRDDLRLMCFASLDQGTGELVDLTMRPLQARRMRLDLASDEDAAWLGTVIQNVSAPFGTRVEHASDGLLVVRGTRT